VGFQANTAQGVIIVEDEEPVPYAYDKDLSFFLQDYFPLNDSTIEAGLVANPFEWSGEAESIQINGFSGNSSFSNASDASCTPYVINVTPGTTYRMRFISGTALSLTTLGFEDHTNLTIIEADGEYTKPWSTGHLQLGSGQRFSIVLKTKTEAELAAANKTSFWVRYENRDRPTNISGYAFLQYTVDGSNATRPSDLPAKPPITLPSNVTNWAEYALEALKPAEVFPKLSEVTRTVTITMRQVLYNGAYVNGTINGTLEWALVVSHSLPPCPSRVLCLKHGNSWLISTSS
jgi:FtsP/CotA-like multicopper oxidase with cupredoxin domain